MSKSSLVALFGKHSRRLVRGIKHGSLLHTCIIVWNPYDVSTLFDPDDDDADMHTVSWGGKRLEIDDVIDLQNSELVDRFDKKKVAPVPSNKKQKVTVSASEWKPTQYEADKLEY